MQFICVFSFLLRSKIFFISTIVYLFFLLKISQLHSVFCYSLINFYSLFLLYICFIFGAILYQFESQFRLGITLSNINIFISNIGIYFIPFFFNDFFQKKYENLKLNQSQVFFIILSTLILLFTFSLEPSQEGGGIIFRFLSLMYLKGCLILTGQFLK